MTQEEINKQLSEKLSSSVTATLGKLQMKVLELEAARDILTEKYTAVVQELNEYKSVSAAVEDPKPMKDIVVSTGRSNKERIKDGD